MFSNEMLTLAHRFSMRNKTQLLRSDSCGCFYCRKNFSPSEIKDWVRESAVPGEDSFTATCPYCGIDAVIGSDTGLPMTAEFLDAMNHRWFG